MEDLEKDKTLVDLKANGKANGRSAKSERLDILKTYKLYIGGKFPRTESGRYYQHSYGNGKSCNVCLASRKDFREAVVAARKAQHEWAGKSAFNRSQILYRIAEMLEGRREQFISEIISMGGKNAEAEVNASIDRLVYFAGWCDKFQQVFSSVNPVESSHFNFSIPEPMGVISVLSPENYSLLGLVSVIAPAIAGGNTVIVLASHSMPLSAITFAEVLNTSDLPAGVVNILTGTRKELAEQFSNHMDVNAVIYCGNVPEESRLVRESAALNVKRVIIYDQDDWMTTAVDNPYRIMDLQEIKTTWHPIGI